MSGMSGEPRIQSSGALHAEGERKDIAWFHPLHKWLVERLHEGKRVRSWLR